MARGYRRRAVANTTYGRRVTRKVNRTARDVVGVFALVSIVVDIAGAIVDVVSWPFRKLFGALNSEPSEVDTLESSEPNIEYDDAGLLKITMYNQKINELRAQIGQKDPTIDWRKVTFVVNGIKGTIQVKSSDTEEARKVKQAYS